MLVSLLFTFVFCASSASYEERVGITIVTDDSYVKLCFGGNQEAALNQTVTHIDAINQVLLREEFVYNGGEEVYRNFGYDLVSVILGHSVFHQFDHQQVINTRQLNATLKSSALAKERLRPALLVFFTGKQLSDGYRGFKCGAACNPHNNSVAVSFYGCPFKRNSEEYKQVLSTTFHELLHGIGVEHSNGTDVMNTHDANNLIMSSSTKELIALRIYAGKGCFLKESNEKFELVYQNGTTKTVILHEVIEHMNAIEKMTMENEGAKNETKTEDIKAEVKPTPEYSTTLSTTWTVIIFVGIFVSGVIAYFVWVRTQSRKQSPLQTTPSRTPASSSAYSTDSVPDREAGLRQRFPTSGN